MAFYDWNKYGKKDWQDDFIEYNIYKDSTSKDGVDFNGSDLWAFTKVAGVVLIVLFLLGSCVG